MLQIPIFSIQLLLGIIQKNFETDATGPASTYIQYYMLKNTDIPQTFHTCYAKVCRLLPVHILTP